ncbi:GH25 family lysozyme [Ureibacillus aquaedulcis]|uniref:Lysozyme n=1 Tax=Ureibacillus aquaedulcis TaxID=3058421 RepID=A0ABT8GKZ0_9BACL|nr:GH25 family lysozyme [Ureibacillus sp. BA0131]MDN4491941.1 GH25 family lysozyme [Ureibacillus sp. BA0131]
MVKKIGQIFITLLFISVLAFTNSAYAIEPESSSEFEGIDVSRYQEDIDFEAVANAGMEAVIIKSSEGIDYTDPNFEVNYEGAKAAGLKVGFYHFLTATTVEQAREEANFFASIINGKEIDIKPVMDFEDLEGLSIEDINAIALTFAQAVESLTGHPVMVYSNADNATNVFGESFTQYSLWLAQYDGSEPSDEVIWDTWAGWQYTDTGSVPGINGDVDLNIFNDGILLENTSTEEVPVEQPGESTAPAQSDDKPSTYVVKSGDTLYSIARMHETTVSAILANNDIATPNLIYPGDELAIIKATSYVIKPGDTLWAISKQFGITVDSIATGNNIKNPDLIYAGDTLMIPE